MLQRIQQKSIFDTLSEHIDMSGQLTSNQIDTVKSILDSEQEDDVRPNAETISEVFSSGKKVLTAVVEDKQNLYLSQRELDGANGLLCLFEIGPEHRMIEIGEWLGVCEQYVDDDAKIAFGIRRNDQRLTPILIMIIVK